MNIIIRSEKRGDEQAIRGMLVSAFPTDQEALLVDRLRIGGRLLVSLVAEVGGEIVGHIAFSPVTVVNAENAVTGAGLAPVAVRRDWQNRGVGSRLIRSGLSACDSAGAGFVVVVGEPDYYRRFGFEQASPRGVTNTYGVDAPFMLVELRPGLLQPGLATYAPEFADLSQ